MTSKSAQDAARGEMELVAGLRAGEESAFERLVREYGAGLLALAGRILGNDEDARDALQDAFLASFRKIKQYSGESRVYAWLHRIVVNASLMKLRKQRKLREQSASNDQGQEGVLHL